MINQTPDHFLSGLKVPDAITRKTFAKLDRYGDQAGKPNENFLNADLFLNAFLKPCEAFRANIGLLMFDFSRFWPKDYEHKWDFIADLDRFLTRQGLRPQIWPQRLSGSALPGGAPACRSFGAGRSAREPQT
jgi:uncharacterized protein YecE (DUF72 family)